MQHKNLTHPNLKTWRQHGFIPIKESGKDNVFGSCIFCGKDKFYVNVETKSWDCKSCNKNGGFQSWLKEVLEYCQQYFIGDIALKLFKDKNIGVDTLTRAGVGFNPYTRSYILPVYSADGITLQDLRIYKNKKLITTANCNVGLYNIQDIAKGNLNIWLMEGEWDALAMIEAMYQSKRREETVLAVPGALTFKQKWTKTFEDMNVNVMYDNDQPGRDGSIKVFNLISNLTQSINFLHWNEKAPKGQDVRDIYKKLQHKPEAFFKSLKLRLKDKPQGIETANIKLTVNDNKFKFDGKYHPPEDVYKVYNKWLEMKNNDVIDILYGCLIANRLPGDPVWLMLVGASSGGKSELLMSFDKVLNVYPKDKITSHTLISGSTFAGGGDPSLIPRLNQKILIIKDFTNLLSLNQQQRDEIFGQLRCAYDGKTSHDFGNGLTRMYYSKFGVMLGTTPAIDIFTEGYTALGERFLRWVMPTVHSLEDKRKIARKASENVTKEEEMREDLLKIAADTLRYDYKKAPTISEKIEDRIFCLAEWTANMRGTVVRDKFSKEILYHPFQELCLRLVKQYKKQLLGTGMFRGVTDITDTEYKLIRHIAVSTVPTKLKEFVRIMYTRKQNSWTVRDLSNAVKLPVGTCERTVEDLRLLDILDKNRNKMKVEYVISDKCIHLMKESLLWD